MENKTEVLINIKDIKKNYTLGKTEIPALKGISFTVKEGDFLSVVGPSGCGKTTLLNIIGCIDQPSGGEVFFKGNNIANFNDDQEADIRLKQIGFIFQAFNLIPVLDIRENIEFPMILDKIPKTERKKRVEELVELVGLTPYISHKPDELSGGQRQRVAIARALVNSPSLVIADEPTANLDSDTGANILEVMNRLNREKKVTFIFSTHNPEVMKFAKTIVHLRDGLIKEITQGEAAG